MVPVIRFALAFVVQAIARRFSVVLHSRLSIFADILEGVYCVLGRSCEAAQMERFAQFYQRVS